MNLTTYRTFTIACLGLIMLFILAGAFLYPVLLVNRGGLSGWPGFLSTGLLIVLYGLLVAYVARASNRYGQSIIPHIFPLIWVIGGIWLIHLTLEYFTPTPESVSRFIFLTIFFLYGVSGYLAARRTTLPGWKAGGLAGMLVAIPSTSLLLVYGFSLNFFFPDRLALILQSEFMRSGLADKVAYVYLNTLESAFSHLLFSLLIGVLLGVLGGFLWKGVNTFRTSHKSSSRIR